MGSIKIIECPRDAWQGLPKNMPAEVKADYLRVLIAAGFKHIDAVSFVSRSAVPQMADSELVLEYLDPPDDVEIIGIVVNAKGAERVAHLFDCFAARRGRDDDLGDQRIVERRDLVAFENVRIDSNAGTRRRLPARDSTGRVLRRSISSAARSSTSASGSCAKIPGNGCGS